jgi:hypothetical protein
MRLVPVAYDSTKAPRITIFPSLRKVMLASQHWNEIWSYLLLPHHPWQAFQIRIACNADTLPLHPSDCHSSTAPCSREGSGATFRLSRKQPK